MGTGFLLIGVIVALLLIEWWAIQTGRPTISKTVWRAIFKHPFLAFLMGYVMGHLTWPGGLIQ